jgi:hypothetical protein
MAAAPSLPIRRDRRARARVRRCLAAWALAALAAAAAGCRAYQPVATVVNKPPETFLTGAPAEHGGGYYRFHVYWYGRDLDGRVERFAWALTDGTLQNPRSDNDEEDQRFNPALNAETLGIARWTTRTDSVFNFTIDDGASPSASLTLHMAAQDDQGAYDRTPARLHFFANSLGNPTLSFFRLDGTDTVPLARGSIDTVGYGQPYRIMWRAQSPNLRGYGASTLALLDTLPPVADGILGYKWRVDGIPGEECDASLVDCWHPRRFAEATNDSFSYFGPDASLWFHNDGGDRSTFRRLLPNGLITVTANAIDIAGVEVAEGLRLSKFQVNYDPQTLVLDGERDWAHPDDPVTYPYYVRLDDPDGTRHPFRSGDRIPDRTYVVVKALARDDPRDRRFDPGYRVGITGYLQGARSNYTGGVFNFASEASALDTEPAWDAGVNGWYGDTLGFLTAPNTTYTVNLLSVDELGRRDGTPASLTFDVGFPPCLQCLEILPKAGVSTSAFGDDVPCVEDPDDLADHPCLGGTTELQLTYAGDGPRDLGYHGTTYILIHRDTGFMRVMDSPAPGEVQFNYMLPARLYRFALMLHGRDDPREAWPEPVRRSGGWRYQVSYACDPYNLLQDGGGSDDIRTTTWGPPRGETISTTTGVWTLEVAVAVPAILVQAGPTAFRAYLNGAVAFGDQDKIDLIHDTVMQQFGDGWVDAVAVDQTVCGTNPERPARYNFFRHVRPAGPLPAGTTWRDCALESYFGPAIKEKLPLSQAAMSSLGGRPVRKHFRLTLVTPEGEATCADD